MVVHSENSTASASHDFRYSSLVKISLTGRIALAESGNTGTAGLFRCRAADSGCTLRIWYSFFTQLDCIFYRPWHSYKDRNSVIYPFSSVRENSTRGYSSPSRHLDKRVCLVILEHRVVFRAVLFDQVALQHQRLQLGIRHDVLKPR